MAQNGLLSKLNLDLIPNIQHMDPAFLGQDWDPNNEYSICKAWGTTGFVYDKTVISRELTTWSDFIDAAQNEASGKTSVLDDPAEITGIYFWANGIDWNTTDPDDLDAAEKFAVEEARPAHLALRLLPGRRGHPAGQPRCSCRCGTAMRASASSTARPGPLAVGPGRAQDRAVDGQLGHRGRRPAPGGRARLHQLRAHARERAGRAGLHRLPHGRGRHRGGRARRRTEMLDLVFFTPEQIATMVNGEVTEAQARIVDIWNKTKAAASA
ncbi:MAG: extracellular solute-binding protein [Schumannella sp.]